jgi:hypothetical protein
MTDTSGTTPAAGDDAGDVTDGAVAAPVARRADSLCDELTVPVPRGAKVLVFSGLRLVPGGTDASPDASRPRAP